MTIKPKTVSFISTVSPWQISNPIQPIPSYPHKASSVQYHSIMIKKGYKDRYKDKHKDRYKDRHKDTKDH